MPQFRTARLAALDERTGHDARVTEQRQGADEVARYVAETTRAYGRIDTFFNNAAIEGKQDLTEEFGSDEFQRVVDINLRGVFLGLKHVLTAMREQGEGHRAGRDHDAHGRGLPPAARPGELSTR
ncbi:SDR family NAD(P)-dependent oxidoreductase [Streptomyces sp. NPDC002795]|uniref:SDR family NAD(P)-dependent oxidoreductase n=1 Tax=Streptomyces sp. NPDC002795 TaxID=3364665 RepID=UPI0036894F80